MKTTNCILGAAILWAVTSGVNVSYAEENAAATAAQADPMTEMQKLAAAGENHKRLEAFVGEWNHTVKWRMNREDTPVESTGVNVGRWILGGRFLQQDYKGQFMGQNFEGLGLTGYDNVREEYTNVWLDNMGTGIMSATAQFDTPTNALNESGTFSCPMTGEKHKPFRAVWKIVDADHYTYDMYSTGKDGVEFKTMEIVYERSK